MPSISHIKKCDDATLNLIIVSKCHLHLLISFTYSSWKSVEHIYSAEKKNMDSRTKEFAEGITLDSLLLLVMIVYKKRRIRGHNKSPEKQYYSTYLYK